MLDVAITGTGVVSALGCDSAQFHARLMAGESGIGRAPWSKPSDEKPAWWGIVREFDPAAWLSPQIESGTDMFAQFALAAAAQALKQADARTVDPLRCGVVHGTSIGGARALMKAQHLLDREGPEAVP